MEPAATRRKPVSKWVWVLSGCGCLTLLTCCPLGFVGYRFLGIGDARNVEAIVREYRTVGLPWTASDLAPNPPIKPGENAADLIRPILPVKGRKLSKALTELPKRLDKGDLEGAASLLAPYQRDVAIVRAASQRPRMDWAYDWDLGPSLLYPEMVDIRDLVKLTCFDAELASRRGKAAAALADLKSARRIGQLAGQEPIMIALLVHIACDGVTNKAIQRCAAVFHGDSMVLSDLSKLCEAPVGGPDFCNSLHGEAYHTVAVCRNFATYRNMTDLPTDERKSRIDPKSIVRSGIPSNLIQRGLMAQMLKTWTRVGKAMNREGDDAVLVARELKLIEEDVSSMRSIGGILTSILFPAFSQSGEAVVKDQADMLVTRALLQAMVTRNRTGKFPSHILDIPGTWIDPFAPLPLHLKLVKGGIRIYRVGPSKVDHGGIAFAEMPKGTNSRDADIVAAYPPVPRR